MNFMGICFSCWVKCKYPCLYKYIINHIKSNSCSISGVNYAMSTNPDYILSNNATHLYKKKNI